MSRLGRALTSAMRFQKREVQAVLCTAVLAYLSVRASALPTPPPAETPVWTPAESPSQPAYNDPPTPPTPSAELLDPPIDDGGELGSGALEEGQPLRDEGTDILTERLEEAELEAESSLASEEAASGEPEAPPEEEETPPEPEALPEDYTDGYVDVHQDGDEEGAYDAVLVGEISISRS